MPAIAFWPGLPSLRHARTDGPPFTSLQTCGESQSGHHFSFSGDANAMPCRRLLPVPMLVPFCSGSRTRGIQEKQCFDYACPLPKQCLVSLWVTQNLPPTLGCSLARPIHAWRPEQSSLWIHGRWDSCSAVSMHSYLSISKWEASILATTCSVILVFGMAALFFVSHESLIFHVLFARSPASSC